MAKNIHKSALISKKAKIGSKVEIGPFCIIGDGVEIKKGTKLISHVTVEGNTEIGENCTVYPFASIGFPPQDLKYKDEKTGLQIGDNNIIREYVSIHRASVGGDGFTTVGDNNFLTAYVHIAHDCKIGNNIVIASTTALAGHVLVEDFAYLGGATAIHQFTRIGAHSMVGGFSGIGQDIPPYTIASGYRAKLYGLNVIGLKRRGFSEEAINDLKRAYKILFREKRTLKEALRKIKTELPQNETINHLIEFIEKNKRGICR